MYTFIDPQDTVKFIPKFPIKIYGIASYKLLQSSESRQGHGFAPSLCKAV
jgi:hypothetical protein